VRAMHNRREAEPSDWSRANSLRAATPIGAWRAARATRTGA
jgi:hypothetical protein